MRVGQAWACSYGAADPSPWIYLVVEVDFEGVEMVLLDSDGDPDCVPGDRVEMSWADVRDDDLVWTRAG